MTSVWCTQFILPLHQEESCGFQNSVSEPFLPVVWLEINTLPWSRLKTYIKNVMAKAWADGLLLQEPQTLPALVWTPHRRNGASYMCHKPRYMMYLIEWAMKDLASESKISMWAVVLIAAAVSSPPSLTPLPSPGRTWKLLVVASPAEDKSDISETHHTGEAEMFWSVLSEADGNLKKMFLYVLRCHSTWLMDRKRHEERQRCIGVLLQERLLRQDRIFN